MLYWIIKFTIMSIIFIFLVHHLINFFKSTLTVPKIKDLINSPTHKYESMYNIIDKQINDIKNIKNNSEYVDLANLLPKPENTMKTELKDFLKTQMTNSDEINGGINGGTIGGTNISDINFESRENSYSFFEPSKN